MEAPDGTASHTKQINETIPMSANTGAQNCMSAARNEPSGCSIDFQLFEDRGRVKKVTKSRTITSLSLVLQTSPERRGLLEGFKTNSKVRCTQTIIMTETLGLRKGHPYQRKEEFRIL